LGNVQIHLENAGLRPEHLDERREIRFQPFAKPALTWPYEEVLRDLLRNRACAANAAASLDVRERVIDRVEIEAPVIREALILRCDDGDLRVRRDLARVDPTMLNPSIRRCALSQHERARRRIDPAQCEHERRAEGDPREDRPKHKAHTADEQTSTSSRHARECDYSSFFSRRVTDSMRTVSIGTS